MRPRDSRIDRAIADAFRMAAAEPYDGSIDDLAARIDAAAAPLLSARRGAERVTAWWDYAARWARALIPAAVALAAASVAFLWVIRPSPAAAKEPSAIVVAVSPCHADSSAVRDHAPRACAPGDLVDRAVEELVSGPPAPASSRPIR